MRRLLFAPLLAVVGLGALGAPAMAKGPVETASGQVVITGPGLPGGSIEFKGTVKGFQEPGDGFMPFDTESGGEFTGLLVESGVLPDSGMLEGTYAGWYVLPPKDLRSIGPAYELRLDMAGDGWTQSMTRRLYPFAPERPLVFVPSGSLRQLSGVRMNAKGLWWSAPPELLAILQSHGLPKTAPPAAEPPPAPASVPLAHPQGWVVLWTGLAFLGLVVAGVLAARRRIRVA